jgi:hypothetical protein
LNNTYLAVQTPNDNEFYTLHFRHTNIETKYNQLLLHDLQTNTITDVTADGSNYGFRASAGDNSKRFKLITMGAEPGDITNNIFPAYVMSNRIFVNNFSLENGVVRLYNLSGSLLQSLSFNNTNITVFEELPKGVYLVQVETETQKITHKAIVY